MINLYNKGYSGVEIAKVLGYKHSNSVRQVIKKYGLMRSQSEASKLAIKKGLKETAIKKLIISAKTTNRFHPLKGHKGENHPMWISDRTKLKQKRCVKEELDFFKEVIHDNNYRCKLTGLAGTLSVHHICGVWSHPQLRFSKLNCVAVSKSIHIKFHKIYGNRSTKEDWEEYVKNKEYLSEVKAVKKRNFVPFEDKTDMRFGRLLVIKKTGKQWECLCDCGNTTLVYSSGLNSGKTKSCGCLMVEVNRNRLLSRKIHLLSPASKKGTVVNRKNKNI